MTVPTCVTRFTCCNRAPWSRCTEVDSGARNVDHILDGTLLPEIAESVLMKMAEGTGIASIKVSANLRGQFTYVVRTITGQRRAAVSPAILRCGPAHRGP
jgi:hypothetical protein